ncbi:phosphate acetyltransferase ['Osedax' symbiont bacterium Rs2_46_30_T18]|nr:phosphate acetyltransferase ['Osedax' symbiont bacterium Rs2_46_30_T18]
MKALNNIFRRAAADVRHIVLAEGEDPRIIDAAVQSVAKGIATITLLGNAPRIAREAQRLNLSLAGISVIDPKSATKKTQYSEVLYQLRKNKGMTRNDASELTDHPLYYAQLMVHLGDADGSVAGAVYTTSDTVRTAIQIIGKAEGAAMVSSFFLMMLCQPFHEMQGGVIFSDCALIIEPDQQQLAEIALSAAASAEKLLAEPARVSMLSFSTNGSAQHPAVDKVVAATALVKERRPELMVDGDVQLDAAIIPDIAERKVVNSEVKGRANVLVFPSLEAGNIGYKLAERIGKAEAIGPILQGLKKPANDLSRGCSANDVLNVIAITVVQGQ